jgi:hypothetical protein
MTALTALDALVSVVRLFARQVAGHVDGHLSSHLSMLDAHVSGHMARKPSAHDMPFSVSPLYRRPGATHSADTSAIVQT